MQPKKTVLENGVRIVSERMPGRRSAALGVVLEVGSRDERQGQGGYTHLIEHLNFQGTRRRDARRIAFHMDAVGGNVDAYTTRDHTAYTAVVPAPRLEPALELLADMVLNSRYLPAAIRKEKRVVLEEIHRDLDSPEDAVFDRFLEALWPAHPLGRSVLGSESGVRSATRGGLLRYWRGRLRPDKVIVAAAGAVDHAALAGQARRLFSGLKPSGAEAAPSPAPGRRGSGLKLLRRGGEQVHLVLGGPGLPAGDRARWDYAVLDTVLGSGMSSRLFDQIRERRGLAYSVYSFFEAFPEAGAFGLYAACPPDKAATAARLMMAELRRLCRERVTARELKAAKQSLEGALVMGEESASARLGRLVRSESLFGRGMPLSASLRAVASATPERLRSLARRMFQGRDMLLTVLGPARASDFKGLDLRV